LIWTPLFGAGRGDLFEKGRRMMADWATFCGQVPAEAGVIPMLRTDRRRA
jgi:hypothetical protein